MSTLELQSDVVSRDEEALLTSATAEPTPRQAREVLDNFLMRADTSLFLWVFR